MNNLEKNRNDFDTNGNKRGNAPDSNLYVRNSPLKRFSSQNLQDMTNDFNLLNKNLECSDFITRLVGLVLIIKDFEFYDKDSKYKSIVKFDLPLSPTYYKEKSDKRTYTQNTFPSWFSSELKEESNN